MIEIFPMAMNVSRFDYMKRVCERFSMYDVIRNVQLTNYMHVYGIFKDNSVMGVAALPCKGMGL